MILIGENYTTLHLGSLDTPFAPVVAYYVEKSLKTGGPCSQQYKQNLWTAGALCANAAPMQKGGRSAPTTHDHLKTGSSVP